MKEKPKITYLLGAGASAQTFPTYQNFNKTFKDFRAYIENMKQRSLSNPYDIGLVAGSITYDPMDVQRILQEDLMKFEQELYKHNSPDVIARKYFLKGDYRNLGLLKITIDLFFKYLHYSKHTDPRYDAFFSMISNRVNDNIEFDNDCKILTWNYDIKIELSMSGFFNLKDISDLKDYLQILPRANDKKIDKYTFTIYKLNGSSNSSFSNEGYVIRQFKTDDISYLSTGYHQNERDTINRKIIKDYFHYKYVIESDIDNKKDFVHGIRYAWENCSYLEVTYLHVSCWDLIQPNYCLQHWVSS